MNTQLAEQQTEQAPTMEQALELQIAAFNAIQAANNASIDENNSLLDENERLNDENSFVKLQVKTLTDRVNTLIEENKKISEERDNEKAKEKDFNKKTELVRINAEKHLQLIEQKDRELIQFKTKFEVLKQIAQEFKNIANTPKKVRDKIKTLQDNVAKAQGFVTQHKLRIKSLERDNSKLKGVSEVLSRQLDELDYTKFYSKNGDNLAIYPLLCKTNIGPNAENQVPVWYMTDDGIGALYALNEDGEPERASTPKTGIKPKKETMDLIGILLRKLQQNGNVVHSDDMKLLEAV